MSHHFTRVFATLLRISPRKDNCVDGLASLRPQARVI